jgi:ABC-type branched-subunit amino acid transport system substrate-binding protein
MSSRSNNYCKKLKVKRKLGCFILFAVVGMVNGCSQKNSPELRAESIANSEEFLIAVVWPVGKGGAQEISSASAISPSGSDLQNGVELALSQLNEKSASEQLPPVRAIYFDDGDNVDQAIALAYKISQDSSIHALIGHRDLGITKAVKDIYANAGLVHFSPFSGWDVAPEDAFKSPFVISGSYHDVATAYTSAMATNGVSSVLVIGSDEMQANGMRGFFRYSFSQGSSEIGLLDSKDTSDPSQDYLLDALKVWSEIHPLDTPFFVEHTRLDECLEVIRKIRESGFTGSIYTMLLPESVADDVDLSDLNNVYTLALTKYSTGLYAEKMMPISAKDFFKMFFDRFNDNGYSDYSLFGYDATNIIYRSLLESSDSTYLGLFRQIVDHGPFNTVNGNVEFTPQGSSTKPEVVMAKMEMGNVVEVVDL